MKLYIYVGFDEDDIIDSEGKIFVSELHIQGVHLIQKIQLSVSVKWTINSVRH